MSGVDQRPEIVWKAPDGSPVSCVEKIEVLTGNLDELEQIAVDALDDAILMGVDPEQVREVFSATMKRLATKFPATKK